MPGFNAGWMSNAGSGAATGASIGGPWGAAIGAGAGLLLGGLFGGGGPDPMQQYNTYLRGIPGMQGYGGFNPVAAPGMTQFGRFGQPQMKQAQEMLRPQLDLALANQRRALMGQNAATGANVAAGGLSPASAAMLQSQNALGSQQTQAGLGIQFAGLGNELAQNIFGMNLQAGNLEQQGQFGLFDRLFQQAGFEAEFGRQTSLDQFMAEIQRRQLAGQLAGFDVQNQPSGFGDFLSGAGTGLAQAGFYGLGRQWGGG